MDDILQAIKDDKLFGFIKCTIHVPEHLISKFSEFPPIFKNTEISMADIGEHMQGYCRGIERRHCVKKSLISSMKSDDILLLTPLLKQYLKMGLVVTDISLVVEYNGKQVFEWFMEEVCDDRRRADMDPAYAVHGETSKTMGNMGYGGTIMDRTKHTTTSFANEKNVPIHVANPMFKTMSELNDGVYEVEKKKKKVMLDLPIQIGTAVYSYAKLRMLQFWEFINDNLDNDKYQLLEMDTDSLYIAFAHDSIDECVKEDKKDTWEEEKWKWFSSNDYGNTIKFDGRDIPFAQWDKRTPGKFKAEFNGLGMICLNSKVYCIWNEEDTKISCKGTQKKRNELLKEHFLKVLSTRDWINVENAGFKKTGTKINTYTQKKKGCGYFYAKRQVLDDGISTVHLDI